MHILNLFLHLRRLFLHIILLVRRQNASRTIATHPMSLLHLSLHLRDLLRWTSPFFPITHIQSRITQRIQSQCSMRSLCFKRLSYFSFFPFKSRILGSLTLIWVNSQHYIRFSFPDLSKNRLSKAFQLKILHISRASLSRIRTKIKT